MATERVKINPTNFKTINGYGVTTFDSDNFYLKSDATGVFKVGGYERCSVINGTVNSGGTNIADNVASGGFPAFSIGEYTGSTYFYYQVSVPVPRFNKLLVGDIGWDITAAGPVMGVRVSNSIPIYIDNIVIANIRLKLMQLLDPVDNIPGASVLSMCLDNGVYNADIFEGTLMSGTTVYPSGILSIAGPTAWYTVNNDGSLSYYRNAGAGFRGLGGYVLYTLESPSQLSLAVTP